MSEDKIVIVSASRTPIGSFQGNLEAVKATELGSIVIKKNIQETSINPQDIDDAMKLGFNWQRGPFEIMDAVGSEMMHALLAEADLLVPEVLENKNLFYKVDGSALTVKHADGNYKPFNVPTGVIRFGMKRQTMTPILENNSASLFVLNGFAEGVNDLRLIEFLLHTNPVFNFA